MQVTHKSKGKPEGMAAIFGNQLTPPRHPHLIYFGLSAGERKGESHGQLLVFDLPFLHEVSQALSDMIKKLEGTEEGHQEGGGKRTVSECVRVCIRARGSLVCVCTSKQLSLNTSSPPKVTITGPLGTEGKLETQRINKESSMTP